MWHSSRSCENIGTQLRTLVNGPDAPLHFFGKDYLWDFVDMMLSPSHGVMMGAISELVRIVCLRETPEDVDADLNWVHIEKTLWCI